MVILDLEWNRSYDKKPLEDILQIGAIRLDKLGAPITDTFSVFIHPQLHSEFSKSARHLPELQVSLDSELDFPAAYAMFREWCGDETEFAEWGRNDLNVLNANCEYWDLPLLEPEKVYDFQWAFSNLLELGRQLRLCDVIEYLQIPAPFCFHNALHDALYTALVGEWMGESWAFAEKPSKVKRNRLQKKKWKFSEIEFPPQRKAKIGAFQTWELALNARSARKPACPICGEKSWVHIWYASEQTVFYGTFHCQAHGTFPARLTLNQAEDGTWCGRLAVPAVTPNLLSAFDEARKKTSYPYRATERMKRKRRWMARQAAMQRKYE